MEPKTQPQMPPPTPPTTTFTAQQEHDDFIQKLGDQLARLERHQLTQLKQYIWERWNINISF